MTWKELLRRMNTAFDRHPEYLNDTAMCRVGDVLYELDLFRSLSLGRLHLGPAYPYPQEEEEREYDSEAEKVSIAPEEEEGVEMKRTSFSKPKA